MTREKVIAEAEAEAVRSIQWAMNQSERLRRERDTYRTLFGKLEAAMNEYVATVTPMLERSSWANATEKRQMRHLARVARARLYRAQGMTAAAIAKRMSVEDGPGVVWSERQVRRWLASKQG